MRSLRLPVLVLAVLALVPTADAALWAPGPGTTWQIQFSGDLDTTVDVAAYDLDYQETSAETVAALHGDGRKVICYVNAGAWERWRPDKKRFPKRLLGRALDGWPGERWLDIRRIGKLAPILEARMDVCAEKGFDAIEFDNVDGYQNRSGFRLRYSHQVRFNEWLAAEARERGLAPGLKNGLGMVPRLVDDFAFSINEECVQYDECELLQPFLDAGKAVFHIEYRGDIGSICAERPAGFSTIRKRLELDAFVEACP